MISFDRILEIQHYYYYCGIFYTHVSVNKKAVFLFSHSVKCMLLLLLRMRVVCVACCVCHDADDFMQNQFSYYSLCVHVCVNVCE